MMRSMTMTNSIEMKLLVLAGTGVAAIALTASQLPQVRGFSPDELAPRPVRNPHLAMSDCATCHVVDDGRYVLPSPPELDAICLKCHDGATAPSEPHPIARAFTRSDIRKPEDWPAPNGLISCLTCHDIRRGGHPIERSVVLSQHWLRTPPAGVTDFCGSCHIPDRFAKANPRGGLPLLPYESTPSR